MGSNLWDGVARVGKGWVREGNFKFFYYVYTGVRVGSWVGWQWRERVGWRVYCFKSFIVFTENIVV